MYGMQLLFSRVLYGAEVTVLSLKNNILIGLVIMLINT